MNRNISSHFSQLPSANIRRSVFDRSSSHKTSFNVGELVPLYVDEVLPGDTISITTSKVVRLQTLLTPIFDNVYLDTYWFFVPNRLTWEHWENFCGERTTSAYETEPSYQIPHIIPPATGFASGTIADYLGIPVGRVSSGANYPSALPFRGYALICQDFFRDQNLTSPLVIPRGDANQQGSNGSNFITDVACGGKPFKVAKFHDYFTSCLDTPQADASMLGADFVHTSSVPLGTAKKLPVIPMNGVNNMSMPGLASTVYSAGPGGIGKLFKKEVDSDATFAASGNSTSPINLVVPDGIELGRLGIEDLRIAFATQAFLEKSKRSGSRYSEMLKAHFGVMSPDSRLQSPEYLGGNRIRLNVSAVANHAQSDVDFLGDLGANSVTTDIHVDFQKSFTEHGYLFCVGCVRYDHTYSQGLERFWMRKNLLDFYFPLFASLGEQPVYTDEIFYTGSDDVFGYQEAWADYRYKPSRLSGEMRPDVSNSLALWHLGDNYASAPTLSDEWIREDKTNVDRVLAVTSQVSNQVFGDFYFKAKYTRAMPMYSVPAMLGRF